MHCIEKRFLRNYNRLKICNSGVSCFLKPYLTSTLVFRKANPFSLSHMSHISCLITLFEIAYLNGNLNAFLNSFLIVRAVILMGCSCITKDSVMRSK